MRLARIASILLVLMVIVRAQDDPIKLKSDLVTLTATVVDRSGRAIRSLKAADFTIYEDGVKQQLSHFAATEEPFSVLLLLDLSGSTQDDLELIKRAAMSFVDELRDEDRVGVIAFGSKVQTIADQADSRVRTEAAIQSIARPSVQIGPRFTASTGTSFYDALRAASEQLASKQTDGGRKAIVCMSDGVDSTSRATYKDIAPIVERSEASVYFLELNTEEMTLEGLLKPRTDLGYIDFSQSQVDRYYDRHDPQSMERFKPRQSITPVVRREINAALYAMARQETRALAERAGGRVYPVNALTDLAAVYRQVASDLRSQYSMSYYPADNTHDGRWRAIQVQTRVAGATVRTRSGYWAK